MNRKRNLMFWGFSTLIVLFVVILYIPFQRDISQAYRDVNSIERQVVESNCGPIEFAVRGEGEVVLVSHGIGGGFDQALGIARSYLGDGYEVIAPSRFGYHSTPLPEGVTPASQADAFVCLMDSLGIEKVTLVANSAGGTSALQMALRHPERLKAIVFISTAAPTVGESISLPPKPVIKAIFSSDFIMWLLTTHFETAMRPVLGVPEGFELSAENQAVINAVMRSILPIKPRTDGFVFDMFTSNLDMDQNPAQYPVEEIKVPTLIIHAEDDSLAKYENAKSLADRIPTAELVTISNGGHLLLNQEKTVQLKISQFIKSIN